MMRTGLIYKATNSTNGKIYIGKTVKTLQRRRTEHESTSRKANNPTGFHGAIRKYGESNFTWETLHECEVTLLNDLEISLIKSFRSDVAGIGYNLTSGGDGAAFGDKNVSKRPEVREKMRIANTGYKHTAESLSVMSRKSKEFYRGGMSAEQRAKISKGLLSSKIRKPTPSGKDSPIASSCKLIDPAGNIHYVKGFREFGLENDLDHSAISKVVKGKLKTHKGWKLFVDTE